MNFPGRACIRPPGSLVCTTTTCVGRIGRRYWTGAKSGIPPVRSTGVVHRGYAGCWIQPSENSILPRRSVPPVSKTFPTASLMRNHLLNTACRGRIEGRKGHKDAQKDAERHPKSRSLSEAALSDAVGSPLRFQNTLGRPTQIRTFPYQNRPESRPEIKAPKPAQSY